MLPWSLKRQLIYLFLVFSLFVALLVAGYFVFIRKAPSCGDGIQNQDELGVDCGGGCGAVCKSEILMPIKKWSRVFKVKDGLYDTATLIENPNNTLGVKSFRYNFKLHDKNGILITDRIGQVFLNPNEKMVIFESGIDTGKRLAERAFIEFDKNQDWIRLENVERPKIISQNTTVVAGNMPRVFAEIKNTSLFDVSNINVVVVIYDDDDNAIGISSTFINYLAKDSVQDVTFTWPGPFPGQPKTVEIFPRVNLFSLNL